MNLRELASISTAALVGATVSAIAIRLFYLSHSSSNTRRKHYSSADKKIGPPCPFDPSKRKGYLSCDYYFMAIAFLSTKRSKDPNRQVGACLVSQSGILLGIVVLIAVSCLFYLLLYHVPVFYYFGTLLLFTLFAICSAACSCLSWPWALALAIMGSLVVVQKTRFLGQSYVCHAEVNAILNTNHASAAGQFSGESTNASSFDREIRRSGQSSGSSRISDDQYLETKLQALKELLPGIRNRPSNEVSASEVLDEACKYLRELQGQTKDLCEQISQKLATIDSDTPQASTIDSDTPQASTARSSIIPDRS